MDQRHATILQLTGVGMRYGAGAEVLHDLDLTLESGSFHFLVGPSGAGKTSLMRLICLSHPPSRGTMTLFGRDIAQVNREELAAIRQRVGVVFQDFRLLDHISAFDNVALPLRINGVEEDKITGFVSEMMNWLGLAGLAERKPQELSMGQRQMIAIARAVVSRPRILLADEPTSNVDSKRAERLMHLFGQLHTLGTAVILATHNEDLLKRYPHPVLRMEEGRLIVPGAATAAD